MNKRQRKKRSKKNLAGYSFVIKGSRMIIDPSCVELLRQLEEGQAFAQDEREIDDSAHCRHPHGFNGKGYCNLCGAFHVAEWE